MGRREEEEEGVVRSPGEEVIELLAVVVQRFEFPLWLFVLVWPWTGCCMALSSSARSPFTSPHGMQIFINCVNSSS